MSISSAYAILSFLLILLFNFALAKFTLNQIAKKAIQYSVVLSVVQMFQF